MTAAAQFPMQHDRSRLSAPLPDAGAALPALQALAAGLMAEAAPGRRETDGTGLDRPPGGRRGDERQKARDDAIRVDTERLDQVLNLSGEIGLTKNRLTSLRADILAGRRDADTLHALDQAVSQLDLLVSDLQNSVMKTRMQPIGRLFELFPRQVRDLARQHGKEVELVLDGVETEVDKTMIDMLAEPFQQLVRHAIEEGAETPEERSARGKPGKASLRLEARQEGDHILLSVADDGRGLVPTALRARAVAQRLLGEEEANGLDEQQSLNLILLPGFAAGRGGGLDAVRATVQKLSGTVEVRSEAGKGTAILISLPLTLAILPVLLVLLGEQPLALPLSMVREILTIDTAEVREVGGNHTLVVRGEVLPLMPLAALLGWEYRPPARHGVLVRHGDWHFVLGVDGFAGRDDAVIKSLDSFRPQGILGVTTLANGRIVLILDMKELLAAPGNGTRLVA